MATLSGDWEVRQDDASGAAYYYNVSTGEASWDPPDASASVSDGVAVEDQWTEAFDESGRAYFVNLRTMETRWELPSTNGAVDGNEASSGGADVTAAASSSVAVEGNEEGERLSTAEQMEKLNQLLSGDDEEEEEEEEDAGGGTAGSHADDPAPAADSTGDQVQPAALASKAADAYEMPWVVCLNESDGVPYYYNHSTGECVWEPPVEFAAHHLSQPEVSEQQQRGEVKVDEGVEAVQRASAGSSVDSETGPASARRAAATAPKSEEKARRGSIEPASKSPVGSSRVLLVQTPSNVEQASPPPSEASLSSATVDSLPSDRGSNEATVTLTPFATPGRPKSSRPGSALGSNSSRPRTPQSVVLETAVTSHDAVPLTSFVESYDPDTGEFVQVAESEDAPPSSQRQAVEQRQLEEQAAEQVQPTTRLVDPSDEIGNADIAAEHVKATAELLRFDKAALVLECAVRCFLARRRVQRKRAEATLRHEEVSPELASTPQSEGISEVNQSVGVVLAVDDLALVPPEALAQREEDDAGDTAADSVAQAAERSCESSVPDAEDCSVPPPTSSDTAAAVEDASDLVHEMKSELTGLPSESGAAVPLPTSSGELESQPQQLPAARSDDGDATQDKLSADDASLAGEPPRPPHSLDLLSADSEPTAGEATARSTRSPAPLVASPPLSTRVAVVQRPQSSASSTAPRSLNVAQYFQVVRPPASASASAHAPIVRKRVAIPTTPGASSSALALASDRLQDERQARKEELVRAAQAAKERQREQQALELRELVQLYTRSAEKFERERRDALLELQRAKSGRSHSSESTSIPSAVVSDTDVSCDSSERQETSLWCQLTDLRSNQFDDTLAKLLDAATFESAMRHERLLELQQRVRRLREDIQRLDTRLEAVDLWLLGEEASLSPIEQQQHATKTAFQAKYASALRRLQTQLRRSLAFWQTQVDAFPSALATSSDDVNAQAQPTYWCRVDQHYSKLRTSPEDMCKFVLRGLRDANGDSLLHVAAWNGQLHVVEKLLALGGVDVNAVDSSGSRCRPLHEACRGGHANVARVLVAAGARLDAVDAMGDSALHIACRLGWSRVARVLLAAAAAAAPSTSSDRNAVDGPSGEPPNCSLAALFQLQNLKKRRAIDIAKLPSLVVYLQQLEKELLPIPEQAAARSPTQQQQQQQQQSRKKTTARGGAGGGRTRPKLEK